MRTRQLTNSVLKILIICSILVSVTNKSKAQGMQFGLYADPLISWYTSDVGDSQSDGARPGFAFGLTFDRYFADNYAFSTGLGVINASGRMFYNDTITLRFKNSESELQPYESINYRVQYLVIPLGIKLRTNQIGYLTFFANPGLDPKIMIGSKADVPSLDVKGESISNELNRANLGYHITVGAEYSLGGNTALVFGLMFEDNFFDLTYDYEEQPTDIVRHYMIRFRFGINF